MSVHVSNKDIVLLGHGSYSGGAKNFKLPETIDLYVLQPVGYTLMTDVAAALITQQPITKILLHHANGSGNTLIDPPMAIYRGGELAPDLMLYDLGELTSWGQKVIGNKKNVITVSTTISLSDLITTQSKIKVALDNLPKGEKLKLYWSACASQVSGNNASLP
ncbi:putative adhesin [Joostella sp.]|uniref:putative adhesin n=1 Tax=Joostella sp. TaxID=2231138 RepID=UPI003A955EC6